MHPRRQQQFPFYKTYIDLQCRKDILVQNQHVNKKMRARMTPFVEKMMNKAKQNKLRLAYFFGFIVLFKMEPVYDYVFCENRMVSWVWNNVVNYYMDFTNVIPKSAMETSEEARTIEGSQQKKRLAELFYKIDKHPNTIIGYNFETNSFVNNPQYEITFEQYLQVCKSKYQLNYGEIELNMKNAFNECLL